MMPVVSPPSRRYHRHRRGAIFVISLGITVILSAMLLVYVQEMRTESVSAANRVSSARADAVEQAAEQWVLAQVEANVSPLSSSGGGGASGGGLSSSSSTTVNPTSIPAEALQVGDGVNVPGGYFWILNPDPTQDLLYGFGIVDESSKLNLNGATVDQLMNLPNMTQDVANNIAAWPSTAGPQGTALNYETVEELLMVDNMSELTPQFLYGYDLNRDGVIDDNERSASNGAAITNGTTQDARGIFNYLTTFSTSATPGSNGSTTASARTPKTIGLINVNTAPVQVLMCVPGMTLTNAQQLVSYRSSQSTPTTGTSWLTTAIGRGPAAAMTAYITGVSYQYSADIVAVSNDGRSFKRVRIVVDARAQPAAIVYRKDLSNLGWPLPAEVRASMQAGQGVPQSVTGVTNKQTSGGF
jgi:DNA uptake protein ComE-like DNA-binding protein/competence protein ComGC